MLWQRAIFSAGLCIHGQHCAVNGIKVGKIIRCLRLPQFAIRQVSASKLNLSITAGLLQIKIFILKNITM